MQPKRRTLNRLENLRPSQSIAFLVFALLTAFLALMPSSADAAAVTLSCSKTSNATANSVATSVTNTTYTLSISGNQILKGSAYQCAGVVTIPQGITSIEFGAFVPWSLANNPLSNPYITSIVWPSSSLTAINYGLINLSGLTSLVIPSSVTSISSQAIQGTTALTSATVEGTTDPANPLVLPSYMFNQDVLALTIGNGYVNFGPYFDNGSIFTSVTLGPNVRSIGQNAFQRQEDSRAFTSISIPSGVTTIGDAAFADNPYLTSVSFGTGTPGLTSIAANSFGHKEGQRPTVINSVQYCGLTNPNFSNATLNSYLFANLPNASIYCSQAGSAPAVTSVSPSQGLTGGGTAVTIQGTDLTAAKVYFNGTALAVSNNTANSLQFTAPAGSAGNAQIMVVTNNGSATRSFSYVTKLANTVTISSTPAPNSHVGDSYSPVATATAGPVAISVDLASANICSIDGSGVVNYLRTGNCVLNFNQAGDATYALATQVQQTITVNAFTITIRNVTVAVPVTNAVPQTSVVDNGEYTASISWTGTPSTFAANTAYTATVTITPNAAYTLSGVSANFFTVNGNAPTSPNLVNAGSFQYLFPATAKTTITTRNLLVTAPTLSAVPQTSITSNGQYTATVTWSGSPSIFLANTIYTATVTVTPTAAYTLTGVSANFFTVNGNAATSGNQINSGTFTYTFPAFWQISFVPNGGTGTQNSQFFQTGGTPVDLPSTATFVPPTGKVFGGWSTSALSTSQVTVAYQTAAPITYYAIWTQTNHTVIFDKNGADGTQNFANQTANAPSALSQNIFTYSGRFFLNWNTSADGTGTQYSDQAQYQFLVNVRLYAQWGQVVFYANTGADSGSPSRSSDNWTGGSISLPTQGTMVKAGYDFGGWRDGTTNYTSTFTPTTVFNLTPVWTAHTYTISFTKTGNAVGSVPANQTWTTGNTPLTLPGNIGSPSLSLIGYTFGGWATQTTPNTPVVTYSTFSDQAFIPIWNPIPYSVTYNLNGGDGAVPTQGALNIGQNFTLPSPTRANYAFLGWQLDGTSSRYSAGFILSIGASSATSLSFTAQWVAQYTVSYAMNGSTTVQTSPSNVGLFNAMTLITLPATPNLVTGYSFAGWLDSNGVLHPAGGNFEVIQNSVLSAQWTPISYSVNYSLGAVAGSAPAPISVTINSAFNLPLAPSKPGYIFSNWNTAADGSGMSFVGGQQFSVTSAGNISMTAQWAQIPYTVTFDLGGGTGTKPSPLINKHVGDSFTLPASAGNPTWKAHTFQNWTDGANSYAPGSTYTLDAASVTLTAVFQLNGTTPLMYSFGSNPGQGLLPTQTPELEGTVITLKSGAGLSRSGYTFAGWTDGSNAYRAGEPYVVPTYSNPVTFSPIWNSGYVVTYSSGTGSGPVPTDNLVRYRGDTFIVPISSEQLVKVGFTFNGWNDGVSTYKPGSSYTLGDSSVSLTAQWVQNSIYAALGTPMTELSHKTLHSGVGYPNETFSVGSSTVSYSIPVDAFGDKTDNMDFHIYALSDASTLAGILPSNQTYILPTIITWLAADGSVPTAISPLTQTISSNQIQVGTTAYALTGTTYTIVGVATQSGSITISISEDPLIVLGNPISPSRDSGDFQEKPPVDSVKPEPIVILKPVPKTTIVASPISLASNAKVVSLSIGLKTKSVKATQKTITKITLTGLTPRISVTVKITGKYGQVYKFPTLTPKGSSVTLSGIKFLESGTSTLSIVSGKSSRIVKFSVK